MEHIGTVIQGLTLAAIMWNGRSLVRLLETVAVHEWRLSALEKGKDDK